MVTDFRCDRCGTMLRLDSPASTKIECPHCRKIVKVPPGIAALPRPLVAPSVQLALAGANLRPAIAGPFPIQDADDSTSKRVIIKMAAIMPWLLSTCLHVALGLILAFIAMFVKLGPTIKPPPPLIDPVTSDFVMPPKGTITIGDGMMFPGLNEEMREARQNVIKIDGPGYTQFNTPARGGMAMDATQLDLADAFAMAGGGSPPGGGPAKFGPPGGGNKPGQPGTGDTTFYNHNNAYHIVYVVDRSGSMAEIFDGDAQIHQHAPAAAGLPRDFVRRRRHVGERPQTSGFA